MYTSSGVAIQPLLSHSLLYSDSALYLFKDSNLNDYVRHDFPLFNSSIFTTFNNYLLCQPDQNHISIYEFDCNDPDQPPAVYSSYLIPQNYKISVASWATYSSPDPVYIILGTRDGTLLRIDLNQQELIPLTLTTKFFPDLNATPTPFSPSNAYLYPAETPICDTYCPSTSVSSSPSSSPFSPATPIVSTNMATVSSIAPAPCGRSAFAIGYAAGHISIIQLTSSSTFREIHKIPPSGTPNKIDALAWHYSSKNPSSQSLAALKHRSEKLVIWAVDIVPKTASFKKIREVSFPSSQKLPAVSCIGTSSCSSGSSFVQWSKSGKIVRVSSNGLLVSDVRTKNVTTETISIPGSVVAVNLRSNKGKAVVLSSQGLLYSCNLLEDQPLSSLPVPFSIKSDSSCDEFEDATILASPVVFLQPVKVGQVTQITIKQPDSPPKQPLKINFSMAPVKATLQSLFPHVLKNLAKMPLQQVPEFLPSQLSVEQYIVCALFAGVFETTACLMGIRGILHHCVTTSSQARAAGLNPHLRHSVFRILLLQNLSHPVLSEMMQHVDNVPKPLLSALLSCNFSKDNAHNVLPLFQSALKDSNHLSHLHLSAAYLYANSHSHDAQKLYLDANLYIEAVTISLLDPTLDVMYVLKEWLSNLKSTNSSNVNFTQYLSDLISNIESGLGLSLAYLQSGANPGVAFASSTKPKNDRYNGLRFSSPSPERTYSSNPVAIPMNKSPTDSALSSESCNMLTEESSFHSSPSPPSSSSSPSSSNSSILMYTHSQQQPFVQNNAYSRSLAGSRSDNQLYSGVSHPEYSKAPQSPPVSHSANAITTNNTTTPVTSTSKPATAITADTAIAPVKISANRGKYHSVLPTKCTPMSSSYSMPTPRRSYLHNSHSSSYPLSSCSYPSSSPTNNQSVPLVSSSTAHFKQRSLSPNFSKSVYTMPSISGSFM